MPAYEIYPVAATEIDIYVSMSIVYVQNEISIAKLKDSVRYLEFNKIDVFKKKLHLHGNFYLLVDVEGILYCSNVEIQWQYIHHL